MNRVAIRAFLIRVAVILAVTCAMIILVTGPWKRSAGDEEMGMVILGVGWGMVYLTKPRRTRN